MKSPATKFAEDFTARCKECAPPGLTAYWNRAPDQPPGDTYVVFSLAVSSPIHSMSGGGTIRFSVDYAVFAKTGADAADKEWQVYAALPDNKVPTDYETGVDDSGYHMARRRVTYTRGA